MCEARYLLIDKIHLDVIFIYSRHIDITLFCFLVLFQTNKMSSKYLTGGALVAGLGLLLYVGMY
jgi:hypothetical protein